MAHVGTFNANPICAAAAVAAIAYLELNAAEIYPRLEAGARELSTILETETRAAGLSLQTNQACGVICAFVTTTEPATYFDTLGADAQAFRLFAKELLEQGVHVIPRGLMYVSTEHGKDEFDLTREAAAAAAANAVGAAVEAA
jgi:glutamate-1-semialdehyde 2,1-aminomutase